MRTFSTDEYFNAEFDHAVVDIDEQKAKIISGLINLFEANRKSNPDLVEMYFRDPVECKFYSAQDLAGDEDEVEELLDDDAYDQYGDFGWAVVGDDFEVPKDHQLGEVYLVIGNGHFYWHVLPESSIVKIESQVLQTDLLQRVL